MDVRPVEGGGRARPTGRDHTVLALPWPRLPRYRTAAYEGNNRLLRSPTPSGDVPSGAEVARRWRAAAAHAGRVFVLRDSLYSQQDHPFRGPAWAGMLPPAWISVAVDHALSGRALRLPRAPPPEADGAWRRMDVDEAFGSFPPSPALFGHASTSLCDAEEPRRAWVVNARRTLAALTADARALAEALPRGADSVARVGAARVSRSDRRYFGDELRRARVVPILVENPSPEEVRIGKGLRPRPPMAVARAAADRTRSALLRARLRDGEAAIERYDLSSAEDRERARRVVREALDDTSEGGRLWVWLTGPAAPDGGPSSDAPAAVAAFRRTLAGDGIDPTRLGFFFLPSQGARPGLLEEIVQAADPVALLVRAGPGPTPGAGGSPSPAPAEAGAPHPGPAYGGVRRRPRHETARTRPRFYRGVGGHRSTAATNSSLPPGRRSPNSVTRWRGPASPNRARSALSPRITRRAGSDVVARPAAPTAMKTCRSTTRIRRSRPPTATVNVSPSTGSPRGTTYP